MKLIDVVDRLAEFDEDLTIYVGDVDVASGEAEATVDYETDDGEPPDRARGMRYLLEVSLAKDAIRVWSEWRAGAEPSIEQKIEAVVHYAKHDAFIPTE